MGVFSVWSALANSDGSFKNPKIAATIFGVFWSGFVLLGVYLLVFSRNYKLVVDASTINQSGAFSTRRIVISEIESAIWRNRPAGYSIKLRCRVCCMSIEFGTIDSCSRDWLIDFLRATIPKPKQLNWESFLLNRDCKTNPTATPPFQRAMLFNATAVSFVAAWILGLGTINLLGALLNSGFATFLLIRKLRDIQTVRRPP